MQGLHRKEPCEKTSKDGESFVDLEGKFLIKGEEGYQKCSLPVSTIKVEDEAVLVSLKDITEMLNAERPLTEADRGLSLLSLITRHDPLNTLTVMGMLVELMTDDIETPCGRNDYLEKLRRARRYYSSYEVHQQPPGPGVQVPGPDGVLADMADQYSFKVTIDDAVADHEVFTDPILSMVFRNILDNAENCGVGSQR